jgi:hypothetical protein
LSPATARGRVACDGGPSATVAMPSDRDRTIRRLAVLKGATELVAGRHDIKSGDVLRIATLWGTWILRGEEGEEP